MKFTVEKVKKNSDHWLASEIVDKNEEIFVIAENMNTFWKASEFFEEVEIKEFEATEYIY